LKGKIQLRLLAIFCWVVGFSGYVFLYFFWGKLMSFDSPWYAYGPALGFAVLFQIGYFFNIASKRTG
jgi:hypothetical protein